MTIVGWLSDLIADGAQVHKGEENWGMVTFTILIPAEKVETAFAMAAMKVEAKRRDDEFRKANP